MGENEHNKMTSKEIFDQLYGKTDRTKAGYYDVCDDYNDYDDDDDDDDADCYCE